MTVQPRVLLATPILALAGLLDAGYLTLVHYRQSLLICNIGDCGTVQKSQYAEIAGIPIALFGAGMYLGLGVLALTRLWQPQRAELLTAANTAIALAGTLYAAYLTYLELFVIHAICQWCVVSAVITVLILLVEETILLRGTTPSPAAPSSPRHVTAANRVSSARR